MQEVEVERIGAVALEPQVDPVVLDGKHAFMACGAYDLVARIDLATWKATARHATGREPDDSRE